MSSNSKIKLFLVDDDALFLKSLQVDFIPNTEFDSETFSSGELCLDHLNEKPDVIVLDYHLDGFNKSAMNGIETLDKIKTYDPEIPVIMLSSQDKIDIAISCMHHRAFDYIVKSETAFIRLKEIITRLFRYKKMEKELNWYMNKM